MRTGRRADSGAAGAPLGAAIDGAIGELLVHRVEEYAWHCGHADLRRECVDGHGGR